MERPPLWKYPINLGETLKVEGSGYTTKIRKQLKISTVSMVVPSTINGIEVSVIRPYTHIGPKTARKIWKDLGWIPWT